MENMYWYTRPNIESFHFPAMVFAMKEAGFVSLDWKAEDPEDFSAWALHPTDNTMRYSVMASWDDSAGNWRFSACLFKRTNSDMIRSADGYRLFSDAVEWCEIDFATSRGEKWDLSEREGEKLLFLLQEYGTSFSQGEWLELVQKLEDFCVEITTRAYVIGKNKGMRHIDQTPSQDTNKQHREAVREPEA